MESTYCIKHLRVEPFEPIRVALTLPPVENMSLKGLEQRRQKYMN